MENIQDGADPGLTHSLTHHPTEAAIRPETRPSTRRGPSDQQARDEQREPWAQKAERARHAIASEGEPCLALGDAQRELTPTPQKPRRGARAGAYLSVTVDRPVWGMPCPGHT